MDEMLKAEIKDIYLKIADLEEKKKFAEVKELLRKLLGLALTPMLRAMIAASALPKLPEGMLISTGSPIVPPARAIAFR